MKNKKIVSAVCIAAAALSAGLAVPLPVQAAPEYGWEIVDGSYYWYENGVKQGTEGRGKEIYDPNSGEWYWLDAIEGGKKAVSKDLYQESQAGIWAEQGNGMGKWVRYDDFGRMVKGWYTDEKGTYYFDTTYGTMAKGKVRIQGASYYFDPVYGTMVKGSVVIDGKLCYYDEVTGIAADRRWVTLDGNDYWYEDGVRQGTEGRGKEINDPATNDWYWLDAVDGGRKAVSKDVYQESQADASGKVGKWVRYDENGHMVKGWDEKDGQRYYFDPVYGTMAKGIVTIDGKSYTFNEENGACIGSTNISVGVGTTYHTQEEIRNYLAASGAGLDNETQLAAEPNLTAPYAAGSLSEQSQRDALAMLNQMRYIAGLNADVTLNEEYTRLVQAASMVNAANRTLSHYPARPEGMEEELYQAARRGAASANLAWSSWRSSLSYSIAMWMDDSNDSNIDRVGHRRWILNPTMRQTGFGYAVGGNGAYSSMYAFDRSGSTDVRGVAWPAREMPVEYFSNDTVWSYSYGESLSDVTVQLVRQNGGNTQIWSLSEGSGGGFFRVENSSYGQKGCVIFRPDGIEINAGDQYLVTISQGDRLLANYTVNFF